jgi:hypothetical protein
LALAIALGPAAVAGWFVVRLQRQRRRTRRSPLTSDLLRSPGASLREQLDEVQQAMVVDVVAMTIGPTFLLSFFFLWTTLGGRLPPMWGLTTALIGVLGFTMYQARSLLRRANARDSLRLGLDAEVAVGQELDQLMRQGAFVFHDLPADKFNLDHVVIAPQGIFAVETKGHAKPDRGQGKADATVVFDGQALRFPTWTTRKELDQAERQARWLAKWLSSATASSIQVAPVLALPGWFVDRQGRGSVRVFNGRELSGLLKRRGPQPLSDQELQRVVHQVEQRCRTVAPTYDTRRYSNRNDRHLGNDRAPTDR